MLKNVAGQHIGCQLTNKTDGSPVTSGTTNVYKIEDSGTQALATNSPATHEGNGWWSYAPAQNETDASHVAFTFVNSSAVVATVQAWPLDLSSAAALQQSIEDAVWDAVASEHSVGISMGGVLGNVPTAGENADAVWDEARSGHVAAGSFGEGVASVSGAVGSVSAGVTLAAGAVTAAAIATGAIDADALAADAVTEIWASSTVPTAVAIADAVWDEAAAGHVAAGTFGLNLDAQVSTVGGGSMTEASIAAEVDSVLSSTHGGGAWGGALTGSRALVLHTQTSGAATIPEARITVRDATDTTTLRVLDTDSAGDVGVALDDGTYVLHVRKAGYVFDDPIGLIVTADATVNVEGEQVTLVAASAEACSVYGYLSDLGLTAHSGVKVVASILSPQAAGGVIFTTKVHTDSSDVSGFWQVDLPQGATVRIQIPAALVSHEFEVPAQSTYDFSEEL